MFFLFSTNWLSSAFCFSSTAILSLFRLSAFLNSRFSDALRTALVLHSSRLRTSFDSWGMVFLYLGSLDTQSPIINIFASTQIQKQETEIVRKPSNFDSLGAPSLVPIGSVCTTACLTGAFMAATAALRNAAWCKHTNVVMRLINTGSSLLNPGRRVRAKFRCATQPARRCRCGK